MTDITFENSDYNITGTEINYYFTCKTQLWLFAHNISMEQNSDIVSLGKQLHEKTYSKEKKDLLIDNLIAIDFIKKGDTLEVHEIKKSNKTKKAHEYQLLYYMYYLKEHKNINNLKGVLNYPLVNKKEEIDLTTEKIEKIKNLLNKINHIIKNQMPHPEKKKMCKNCSYYEFCWV